MRIPAYPVPHEFDDPRFRWFFDYWRERHDGGRLPGRVDIDPLDFPHLLGYINLVDVERIDTRIRYRFRLWGSRVSTVFGADHTGKLLDEIAAPGTLRELRGRFDRCVESRDAFFVRRRITLAGPEMIATSRLLLPLASDGHQVDMLAGLILGENF